MKKVKRLLDKIYNYVLLKERGVQYGNNLQINGRIVCRVQQKGNIILGNNVKINSGEYFNPVSGEKKTCFETHLQGKIVIGNNVGISNTTIIARKGIRIEDNVLLGGGCQIYDNDFHSKKYEMRVFANENIDCENVYIKEGAFVGASTIILKGVTIGARSIIGAGSVVTKDVPDGEIWAGNPAKYIKTVEKKTRSDCENVH